MSEPVTLGPEDRPWAAREYGRVRLTESLTNEMWLMIGEQLEYLYETKADDKAEGLQVTEINRRIRRTLSIRGLVHGMMHEKEWCTCENFREEHPPTEDAETGLR
jgi:uncharacterized alpha-E superfamily protein